LDEAASKALRSGSAAAGITISFDKPNFGFGSKPEVATDLGHFRFARVISTSRRNTGVKSLCKGVLNANV
jgi:hypothetical protein